MEMQLVWLVNYFGVSYQNNTNLLLNLLFKYFQDSVMKPTRGPMFLTMLT